MNVSLKDDYLVILVNQSPELREIEFSNSEISDETIALFDPIIMSNLTSFSVNLPYLDIGLKHIALYCLDSIFCIGLKHILFGCDEDDVNLPLNTIISQNIKLKRFELSLLLLIYMLFVKILFRT